LKHEENKSLKDLNAAEWASFIPILILIVWIGVHPDTFLSKVLVSVKYFLEQMAR